MLLSIESHAEAGREKIMGRTPKQRTTRWRREQIVARLRAT